MSLEGKNAVVTGASSGIGRAVAEELAALGANVVVNGLATYDGGANVLEEAVAEINARGAGRAVGKAGSVADFDFAAELVDHCVQAFGSIDILVNVAGVPAREPFSIRDIELDNWQNLINVHLGGTFNCCRHAAPKMAAQRSGSIVNTTSEAWNGQFAGTGYAAAKAGVIGLSLAMATDLAPFNVRCNIVAPGARSRLSTGPGFEKKMNDLFERGMLSAERRDAALNAPSAEFVGPIYAYLAGDLSRGVSGQMFRASGTLVQHWPIGEPVTVMERPRVEGPWTQAELSDGLRGIANR